MLSSNVTIVQNVIASLQKAVTDLQGVLSSEAVVTPPDKPPTQPPPSGGFPTGDNTGVPPGTTLTPMPASTITVDGTKLTAKDISGHFVVKAKNVVIENCRIKETSNSSYAVVEIAGSNCLIKNCEIIGSGTSGAANQEGIRTYASPVTIDGVKIHEVGHGIALDGNCTIQNCYIYNFNCNSATHVDGIISTNCSKALIQNNTIDLTIASANLTSAVWLSTVSATNSITNVTTDKNQLIYGGYTVRADDSRGGTMSGIAFTNNALGKGAYGYSTFNTKVPVTYTGNYDYKTNAPV